MLRIKSVKKFFLIIVIIAIMITIGSCFISYAKFSTINLPKVSISVMRLVCGESDCIEINSSPKVILAKPSQEFFESFLANEGYSIVEKEQLGGIYTIEKDGIYEQVAFSINRYYSRWQWMGNS